MSLGDLDLEFEDEEESNKKKLDAFDVPSHLLAMPGEQSQIIKNPLPPPQSTPGNVRKINEARPAQSPRPQSSAPKPAVAGATALKTETHPESEFEQVQELQKQIKKIEFESAVKVESAEYKTEILADVLGDMRLLEHQIGQLLQRMHAKHPDLKNEALMIKKILADFTSKKRK